jgi:preprotein translocase subunit SecA
VSKVPDQLVKELRAEIVALRETLLSVFAERDRLRELLADKPVTSGTAMQLYAEHQALKEKLSYAEQDGASQREQLLQQENLIAKLRQIATRK